MNLKGFAVYTTGDSTSSKKRHVHQRHHARNAHHHLQRSNGRVDYEKRNPAGNIVSVAGLGTWTNDYTGGGASTAAPQATSSSTAASDQGTTQDTGVSNKEVSSDNSTSSSGTWTRVAYYDSKSQKADGLTFFNAKQYDGSTNGLSYASSDGTAKASKPTVFNDKMLSDDTEIMMFSDKFCKDDCLPYSGLGPSKFLLYFFFYFFCSSRYRQNPLTKFRPKKNRGFRRGPQDLHRRVQHAAHGQPRLQRRHASVLDPQR